jgi:hypothetical protein
VQGTIVPVTNFATPVPEFGMSALLIVLLASIAAVALVARFQLGWRPLKQGFHSP